MSNIINRDLSVKGFFPADDTTYLTQSDVADNVPNSHKDGLYVVDGAGKTVKVTFSDDSVYTFTATQLIDNQDLNIRVKRVWDTGTTATQIKCVKREP